MQVFVSKYGDYLSPKFEGCRPTPPQMVDDLSQHEINHSCGGRAHLCRLSYSYNAIACEKCNLRLVVPANVETWQDLQDHLSPLFPSEDLGEGE